MDILNNIESRYSCRSFKSKKPSMTVISQILEYAIKAPNAGNLHSFRFVIVDHEDLKLELAKACMDQLWIAQAPYVIVIYYDEVSLKKYYEKNAEKYGKQDASVVGAFISLLAKEFNLDSCFVSAFDEEEVSRITRVPDNVHPEVIIPIGYSDENKKKQEYRPSIDLLSFYNEFGKKGFRETIEDKVKNSSKKTSKKLSNFNKLKEIFKKN